MKTTVSLIMVACAVLLCGCGATVPNELTSARQAYLQASEGPAAQLSPAELHKAEEALALAEAAFKDDADSYHTRDLAYVAQRKAEMAEAHASIATEQVNKARSNDSYQATQGDLLQARTEDLTQTRTALAVSERAGRATADQLAAEQKAHQVTEQQMNAQGVLMQEKNQDLTQTRTDLAVAEQAGQTSSERVSAEQISRLEAEKRSLERGTPVQDDSHELNQARTALALSEQSGRATADQLVAEQRAHLEAENRMAQQNRMTQEQVPAVAPAPQPVQPVQQLAPMQPMQTAVQPAPPVAAPVVQPSTEQLVAERVARLEADRKAMEQTQQIKENAQDLSQTRTALAVSEQAGRTTAEQLAAAQTALAAAERAGQATSEQSRLAQENAQNLDQARADLAAAERAGQATSEQLATEQKARVAAETSTAEAQAALAKLTATKEDKRGEIFTLSGGVLFRSNEATLMPGAETQLDRLVEALDSTQGRNVVVEGYTDSQGSDDHNLALSQRRADVVRNYLVHNGFPADQVQARGIGEGSPVASNETSEGRANNRRVEIVLERAARP